MDNGLEVTGTLSANDIAKKVIVLQAVHFLQKALKEVYDVTIRNCFRHGGFTNTTQEHDSDEIERPFDLSEED